MATKAGRELSDLSVLKIDNSSRGGHGFGRSRWWLAGIVLLIALSSLATIALRRTASSELQFVTARVASTLPETLLNGSGYVTPRRRATISAKITGRVAQVLVEEGMRVHEGQVLALLDDSEQRAKLVSVQADQTAAQAEISELQINLANSERVLRRTTALHQAGIATKDDLDQSQSTVDAEKAHIALKNRQVDAAEAHVKVAQQDMEYCVVRAPFAGLVVSKDAQVGEMVSPNSAGGGFTRTGIATVVDMTSLEVEVDVNESYIARVELGQPVVAVLDAYPDWQIPAKVRTVIPTADRQKATVKVRIAFDRLDPRIVPDMGVKVALVRLEDKNAPKPASAVLIPKQAIRQDDGTDVVFVRRNGAVERRAVRVGAVRGEDQEVIAGLAAGNEVVVRGFENIPKSAWEHHRTSQPQNKDP
jgi:RND family efflux transporter MFP subunit